MFSIETLSCSHLVTTLTFLKISSLCLPPKTISRNIHHICHIFFHFSIVLLCDFIVLKLVSHVTYLLSCSFNSDGVSVIVNFSCQWHTENSVGGNLYRRVVFIGSPCGCVYRICSLLAIVIRGHNPLMGKWA